MIKVDSQGRLNLSYDIVSTAGITGKVLYLCNLENCRVQITDRVEFNDKIFGVVTVDPKCRIFIKKLEFLKGKQRFSLYVQGAKLYLDFSEEVRP